MDQNVPSESENGEQRGDLKGEEQEGSKKITKTLCTILAKNPRRKIKISRKKLNKELSIKTYLHKNQMRHQSGG